MLERRIFDFLLKGLDLFGMFTFQRIVTLLLRCTLLHVVALHKSQDIAECLVASGTDVNTQDRWQNMEIVAKEKGQVASASHEEVDLDELLDDPKLEKLHADRIVALNVLICILHS
ncbi:hypothetical protein GUJ93_ZPchr0006g42567 [Zizania palustris]|uniref:Uncharacterized protein n=1 Tax=Zizania palustris TaxID=103762 RepID=A0A8J5TBD5_ZIZPA|nr:hypothetical protein GUJ93_ZPchr0006g42567 [Zizania palustris]